MSCPAHLHSLNDAQRAAVECGISNAGGVQSPGPLLIIAGARTGKTNTLAHRIAHLILNGAAPDRILLLTFTRRAAAEMTRRTQATLARSRAAAKPTGLAAAGEICWSGTFHAIANRLLREHAQTIAIDPSFTVLDRGDAADRLDFVRNELGLAKTQARFPRKETCLSIYSHTVNARCPVTETLKGAFPWCAEWEPELKRLFRAYVEAKQSENVLDYDDLLLYWADMMEEPAIAQLVGERFDHVLVDEYQDTNALQAQILLRMKPDGGGLTVVGTTRSRSIRFGPPAFETFSIFQSSSARRRRSSLSSRTTDLLNQFWTPVMPCSGRPVRVSEKRFFQENQGASGRSWSWPRMRRRRSIT